MLASITSQMTGWIAHHSIYAVFALMALDALLPLSGEVTMLYAGALASGAVAGQHATLFGLTLASGTQSFVTLAVAGTLGYLLGALVGWAIGARGGRPLIERHGRWLHVSPATFRRAEAWFDRYGRRAVFLGRLTPVVRSFISIPAGALGSPLGSYTVLTLLGSLVWCFGFAAAGWAVGGSWTSIHHGFEYVVVAGLMAVAGAVVLRRRRRVRAAA
jgi:membrane protein DedA with SNARE-associated domain